MSPVIREEAPEVVFSRRGCGQSRGAVNGNLAPSALQKQGSLPCVQAAAVRPRQSPVQARTSGVALPFPCLRTAGVCDQTRQLAHHANTIQPKNCVTSVVQDFQKAGPIIGLNELWY